jgi:hypothetical protein
MLSQHATGPEVRPFGTGIAGFGTDPASKFATESAKLPSEASAIWIPVPGGGQLSGRVAPGLDFAVRLPVVFHTVQGCRPARCLLILAVDPKQLSFAPLGGTKVPDPEN